jgi:hypothetical protein
MDQDFQNPQSIRTQSPAISEKKDTLEEIKSTKIVDLLLIALIGYFFLSLFAAIYFITITKINLTRLSQLVSLSSNIGKNSLNIPICVPSTNNTALRTSFLENEYAGKIQSLDDSLSSKSANFHSSVTLFLPNGSLFTYYITKNEINRLVVFDDLQFTSEKASIKSLKAGDRISIKETINLKLPPKQGKTRIEITKY